MNTLQGVLEEALSGALYREAAVIISSKLAAQSITLSKRDIERLAKHLGAKTDEAFKYSIWRWWKSRDVAVDIDESEINEIQARFERFLNENIQDFIHDVVVESSASVLATLRRRCIFQTIPATDSI